MVCEERLKCKGDIVPFFLSSPLFRLDRNFHELYIPNQFSYIY